MIDLYTFTTPNGRKPAILLEELQMPYTIHSVNISKNEQFAPEFLAISPNNKIPAIVDRDNDLAIFESGAILIYLAEKAGQLLPTETGERIRAIEWLMFQMASVGPMFGQLGHFRNFAPEKLPYAINRYEKEVLRLLGVMEGQLAKAPFLAGDYSIADIATYPWVSAATTPYMGLTFDDFSNVQRWVEAIAARPAVKVGMDVLQPTFESQFGTVHEAKA